MASSSSSSLSSATTPTEAERDQDFADLAARLRRERPNLSRNSIRRIAHTRLLNEDTYGMEAGVSCTNCRDSGNQCRVYKPGLGGGDKCARCRNGSGRNGSSLCDRTQPSDPSSEGPSSEDSGSEDSGSEDSGSEDSGSDDPSEGPSGRESTPDYPIPYVGDYSPPPDHSNSPTPSINSGDFGVPVTSNQGNANSLPPGILEAQNNPFVAPSTPVQLEGQYHPFVRPSDLVLPEGHYNPPVTDYDLQAMFQQPQDNNADPQEMQRYPGALGMQAAGYDHGNTNEHFTIGDLQYAPVEVQYGEEQQQWPGNMGEHFPNEPLQYDPTNFHYGEDQGQWPLAPDDVPHPPQDEAEDMALLFDFSGDAIPENMSEQDQAPQPEDSYGGNGGEVPTRAPEAENQVLDPVSFVGAVDEPEDDVDWPQWLEDWVLVEWRLQQRSPE
ncbi:hypothetical protein P154DRAFT_582208 [Amniculicola lignicola CBS 123094]|uniref:Uncharacterized protein n=1 Tax=Amniculicola lignicola CBS 123094 TaxID=1392246 RepID=A0A6A5VXB8_9PLEO|nr:hypothetical protein P154DRAFT_582208 [Amniculicola lignicola CBS 123094]